MFLIATGSVVSSSEGKSETLQKRNVYKSGRLLGCLELLSGDTWQENLLVEGAEQALAADLRQVGPDAETLFAERDYGAYMQRLAGMRERIDGFFDEVMVMAEDPALRDNRLALLAELHGLFTRVADVARLHEG